MGLTGPVQANDIVMRASEIGTTIPGIASLAMKSARKGAQRGVQGIYQLPSGNEPTPEFMNVSQQNLNNQTQQMTDMLNMMAPEDEQLAYINEQEAGILKLLGGSGEMTPQGIPSFKKDPAQVNRGPEVSDIPRYFGEGEHKVDLAYITEPEAQLLKNLDLHDSNPPHTGPSIKNIPNYNDFGGGGYSGSTGEGAGGGSVGGHGGGQDHGGQAGEAEGAANADASTGPDTDNRDYRESVKEVAEKEATEEGMQNIEDAAAKAEAMEKATVRDKYGNPVTSTNPETGLKSNVFSERSFNESMQDYQDKKTREAFMQEAIDDAKAYAKSGLSRDAAYGLSGLSEFGNEGMGLQGATAAEGLGNMGDRLGELAAKAKANTISNTELDEMAQLNAFYGNNPTTGMGLTESLRYQFTNQQFRDDLSEAAPVLGAVALAAFAPMRLKSIYSIGKALMSFTDTTPKSLRDTMQKALDKLTGKEKDALAKSLPSTYRGFGIQGRGEGGGDRQAAEAEAARKAEEEARRRAEEEERNNRERDRFERSFANRYFVGPASLDEVRKYAVTGGGYNQLTPFYGREVGDPQSMGPAFGSNIRTADFRDYNNDGVDDRDQGINISNPSIKETV